MPLEDVRIIREYTYLLCIHGTLSVMTMLYVYSTQSVFCRQMLHVLKKNKIGEFRTSVQQ